jgi:hypothetical protein
VAAAVKAVVLVLALVVVVIVALVEVEVEVEVKEETVVAGENGRLAIGEGLGPKRESAVGRSWGRPRSDDSR